MSNKFQLGYRLTVESNIDGSAIVIEPPFTVSFSIDKGASSSLNAMNMQIYNLKPSIRNNIFEDFYSDKKQRDITFQAGYDGNLSTIFYGNTWKADSFRQGTDIITNIEAHAGGNAQDAILTPPLTFAAGSSKKNVLQALVSSLPGLLGLGKIGNVTGTFPRSISLEGNIWELIKREFGDTAFIDDGYCHLLKENEAIEGIIPLIDSSTGLLGTPRLGDTMLDCSVLFEPKLILEQVLELKSDTNTQYNGQYIVKGINHSGTISEAIGGECRTKLKLLLGGVKDGLVIIK